MSPAFYHVLHLLSLIVLTGGTFYGFAGPAESRKKVMIFTGIASLLMLISGVGLLHKLSYGFPGWAIVKIVCWLGLAGLAGIGYRKRDKAGLFMTIILALVFVALVMVYQRPF
ncbi:DUF1516 family protein [Actomonas aquatica]|uniref:DUF1516 family protein n=1 Tax=Actomonas aquatica TaxID=2866162 RepID=A0ABZ1C9R9_9BACT|nr:DUF1516 family protein [Opitutus sp. WL0086]WRQ88439.1 DUF1516 family protein [Opitutus sp. WL0086]